MSEHFTFEDPQSIQEKPVNEVMVAEQVEELHEKARTAATPRLRMLFLGLASIIAGLIPSNNTQAASEKTEDGAHLPTQSVVDMQHAGIQERHLASGENSESDVKSLESMLARMPSEEMRQRRERYVNSIGQAQEQFLSEQAQGFDKLILENKTYAEVYDNAEVINHHNFVSKLQAKGASIYVRAFDASCEVIDNNTHTKKASWQNETTMLFALPLNEELNFKIEKKGEKSEISAVGRNEQEALANALRNAVIKFSGKNLPENENNSGDQQDKVEHITSTFHMKQGAILVHSYKITSRDLMKDKQGKNIGVSIKIEIQLGIISRPEHGRSEHSSNTRPNN